MRSVVSLAFRLRLGEARRPVEPIQWTSISLLLLGLGWNVLYVAATAELVTHATPVESGRLIVARISLAGLLGATLALLGGAAYTEWGVGRHADGATVAVLAPALAVLLARRPPAAAPEPAG